MVFIWSQQKYFSGIDAGITNISERHDFYQQAHHRGSMQRKPKPVVD